MTTAALQTSYSPGVEGITVVLGDAMSYCVSATAAGATWFKAGPDAQISQTACS